MNEISQFEYRNALYVFIGNTVLQNKYLNIYYLWYEIFRRRHFRSEHVYYLSTMTGSYLIDISIFI